MRRSTTAVPATALFLVLGLAACTSDAADPTLATASAESTSTATPTAAASPLALSGGGTYATTDAIAAALTAGGLTCEDLMVGSYPGVSEAKSCVLEGTEDAVLLVFADDAERQDYLATREPLANSVVGENWAVQTVLTASADKVAEAVGGTVVPQVG